MSDNEMLYCLIAFILGWLVSRHMGNGFSVGINESTFEACKDIRPSDNNGEWSELAGSLYMPTSKLTCYAGFKLEDNVLNSAQCFRHYSRSYEVSNPDSGGYRDDEENLHWRGRWDDVGYGYTVDQGGYMPTCIRDDKYVAKNLDGDNEGWS